MYTRVSDVKPLQVGSPGKPSGAAGDTSDLHAQARGLSVEAGLILQMTLTPEEACKASEIMDQVGVREIEPLHAHLQRAAAAVQRVCDRHLQCNPSVTGSPCQQSVRAVQKSSAPLYSGVISK